MNRYNLVWRDRGTRTKKTLLDKIAKYAVRKVRKNLMPNLVQRVTNNLKREATTDVKLAEKVAEHKKSKRNRGGIKEKKFVADFYIKKTSVSIGDNMLDTIGGENTDSIISTITSGSQVISQCLQDSIVNHFQTGGGKITIENVMQWEEFKQRFGQRRERQAIIDFGTDLKTDNEKIMDVMSENNTEEMKVNGERCDDGGNGKAEGERLVACESSETSEDDDDDDDDIDDDESVITYTGPQKCSGECELQLECEKYRSVLRQRYGSAMRCTGDGCGVQLYMATTMRGNAYVCKLCKDRKCRYMLCSECFGKQPKGRRCRGRKAEQKKK